MAAGCSEIKKRQYRLREITVLSNSQESSFPFLRVRAAPDFQDSHFFAESSVFPMGNSRSWKVGGRPDPPKSVKCNTFTYPKVCVSHFWGPTELRKC